MMMKNIYEMLQDVCNRNKDSIFFVREKETYADLLKKVKQRAVLLAKRFGIKKGDSFWKHTGLFAFVLCDYFTGCTGFDAGHRFEYDRTYQYDEAYKL